MRTARDPHASKSLWMAAHAERAALAEDLAALDEARWRTPSLCEAWTVEEALAHMTAAASSGPASWLASVVRAGFDFDLHNERRLRECLGSTPSETLTRFRSVISSTKSAPGPVAAWLGEVIVHAEDIRRPLGLAHAYAIGPATEVAAFYARRNLAVPSRTMIRGLRLEASDGPLSVGEGPVVSGTTVALIMAMAGRAPYRSDLTGPGAEILGDRLTTDRQSSP